MFHLTCCYKLQSLKSLKKKAGGKKEENECNNSKKDNKKHQPPIGKMWGLMASINKATFVDWSLNYLHELLPTHQKNQCDKNALQLVRTRSR